MAEGTFQISAEITPVFDQRAALHEAERLQAVIAEKLSKSIKITPQIDAAKATQQVQALAANHEKLAKTVKQSNDEVQRSSGVFARMGDALTGVGSRVSSISGSTRALITNNQRLKASYREVQASTGAIANLPKEFGQLQASVLAGSSAMDKAAKSGDNFALKMLPFLRLGTIMARDLDAVGFSLRGLDKNLKILVNELVPVSHQVPSAFRKMMEATREFDKRSNFQKAREGIRGLREDIGDFARTPPQDGEKFLAATFGSEPGIINGIKRIKQRIKDAFSKGGGGSDAVQLPLFDAPAAKRQASATAKVAADEFAGTVSARIKDKSGGTLKLFEPEVIKKEAKKVAEATSEILKSATGSGKTASFLKDSGGKAGKGWIQNFVERVKEGWKDERGSIQIGMGGSIISGPFKALSKAASSATAPVKSLAGSVGGLGGAFGGMQAAATAAVAALAAVTAFGIGAAIELETLRTALSGVFGDQALQAFADLNRFAAQTPFSLQSATSAVIKLSSAFEGLDPSQAIALLKPFSSAAAAIGASEESIQRATTAIVQIGAAGVLTADNLRQVTEALPNVSKTSIIRHLAQDLKITESSARSMLLNGAVPAAAAITAIAEAARDARGASDALSKQANTLTGRFSTFKDSLKVLAGISFAPLAAGLSQLLKGVNASFSLAFQGLRVLADLGSRLPVVGGKFAEMKVQIDAATSALNTNSGAAAGAIPNLDRLALALGALQNASGFTGQLTALSGVIGAFNSKADDFAKTQGDLFGKVVGATSAFKAQASAAKAVTDAQTRYNDALRQHNDEIVKKTIALTEELASANDRLADANERVADAQTALDEALRGADPQDVERATLALTAANNALTRALLEGDKANQEKKKSQDALNKSEVHGLNLTGLSLDQIKSRLASVRLSLKSQKTSTKIAETQEDKQLSLRETELDAIDHATTIRGLELDVLDANDAIYELKVKGSELDPAVISARQTVRDVEKDRQGIINDILRIEGEINGLSREDLAWTREKAGLQDGITTAKQAQRDADREAAAAVAGIKGDQQTVTDLLFSQIAESPKLLTILNDVNKSEESRIDIQRRLGIKIDENNAKLAAQGLPLNLSGGGLLPGVFGPGGLTPPKSTADALGAAAQMLGLAAGGIAQSDRNMQQLAKVAGVTLPGFKAGAVIDGVNSAFGRTVRVGEGGKDEMVLPLQAGASRVWQLLSQNLPKYPSLQAGIAALTPGAPALKLPSGGAGSLRQSLSRQEARADKRELAQMIAEELAKIGTTGGGDKNVAITVESAPTAQLGERALKRAVEQALSGL